VYFIINNYKVFSFSFSAKTSKLRY